MKFRGRSTRRYCIAHIWCWPTPVVKITSSPGRQRLQRLHQLLRLEPVAARAVPERELVAPLLDLVHPRLGRGIAGLAVLPDLDASARPEPSSAARRRGCRRRAAWRSRPGRCRGGRRSRPGANAESFPVTRSSKRAPIATRTSHVFIAMFDHFVPCMPGPAEEQRMRLGECALAHQRRDHRQASGLREFAQLVAGVAVDRAPADVEHGLLGACDRARRPRESAAGAPCAGAASPADRPCPG